MIIVSQDKAEIINLNNVFRLYVDTWSSEEFATEPDCWCIRAEKTQDNLICVFLGEYKTEERAKEVLQEIVDLYKQSNYVCKIANIEYQETNRIFEMPED